MDDKPKVLSWDAEVTPTLAWIYEPYETNMVRQEGEWFFQSYSYKWLHEKRTHVFALPDFKGYKPRIHNDYALVKSLHDLLSQADILIGHNIDKFDIRKANTRFIKHGLDPIPLWKSVDTLKIARKHFYFMGNSLDALCGFFGLGQKKHHHSDLWYRCYNGDKKAWKEMKEYNAQDVILGEKLYLKLRPWIKNHPNMNILLGSTSKCPFCGSDKTHKCGTEFRKTLSPSLVQRYRCLDCRAPFNKVLNKDETIGNKPPKIVSRN